MNSSSAERKLEVALVGNPNSGKTTLFNSLTGLRQTTGNYPGVTVEKKSGVLKLSSFDVDLLDLPGAYSLLPRSMDEEVVHDVLLGKQKGVRQPDLILFVLDAGNLGRNLYLFSQVVELGIPMVLALTMTDDASDRGISVNQQQIEETFGVPCIRTLANHRVGIKELKAVLDKKLGNLSEAKKASFDIDWPSLILEEAKTITPHIQNCFQHDGNRLLQGEAIRLVADVDFNSPVFKLVEDADALKAAIISSRENIESNGMDWSAVVSETRFKHIDKLCENFLICRNKESVSFSERADRFLTHKVWGFVSFAAVMGLIFQSIFSWAGFPMDLISSGVEAFGGFISRVVPEGLIQSLMVDGVVAGVGNVVIFLPQIFLLFLFIAFLEDLGYMARAAFVLDRLMKKVGLNGKAFLPLLSSFACAIPGIMATRTIEQKTDRLATILVAPLMSCSARLPVYALMIGAFIPATPVLGFVNMQGVTLFSMYVLSLAAGLGMAALFRKTLLKGDKTPFIFELPPYRVPNIRGVLLASWHRSKEFLRSAGTIIFVLSIVLWFLASFPKDDALDTQAEEQAAKAEQVYSGEELDMKLQEIDAEISGQHLRNSYAGRLGHFIEPVIEPLGFDWRLGVGIVASFAAREVLVSTLAIVYNLGADADEESVDLITALTKEENENGEPLYTPLTAISLMVFFVLACQCMSTVAVVKRETASWRWPIFMVFYMTALAWLGSFLVFQVGLRLGFGI